MESAPRVADNSLRRWLAVAALAVVAVLSSLVATAWSGAADPLAAGLTDAGPGVRWAMPLVRAVHDVAAALAVGALLLAATVIPGVSRRATESVEEPRRSMAMQLATVGGFVWAIAGAAGVLLWFADASGIRLTDPFFGAQFTSTVWSIEPLRVGLISAGTAAVIASAATVVRSRAGAAWLTVAALFGVVVLGLAGHAGGSEDHETAVNAMAAHLLAATAWVGGLLALVLLRDLLGPALSTVARRYSAIALWSFVILAVSGVMAASTRFDSLEHFATPYGGLVVIKTLALVVLGVAGWWHREHTLRQLDAPHVGAGSARSRPFLRLAAGELVLMAATFGVATALARTEPPVPETVPNPSAALALTGFPAPAAPTAMSWLTAWRAEWLFLTVGIFAIVVYLVGVRRLRRRGDAWPVLRTVNWVVGWLIFLWATNGALGIYGRVSFSWHMTLHMVEAMVIPIFLVLGAPVTLALRTLTPRKDGTLGPRELLLAVVHSRYLKVVGNPIFAGAFFFGSLVAFYWTDFLELALRTHTGHMVMTVHFMLSGYLFAWVLIGVDPGPKKWSPPLRLLVLFATVSLHAFFGVAMVSGSSVLAPEFFHALDLPWVPDPLADQRLGGSIAWAIGELPSLALAIAVAVQWARADTALGRRRDRAADRDGDAELAAYNARLAQLAQRDAASGSRYSADATDR